MTAYQATLRRLRHENGQLKQQLRLISKKTRVTHCVYCGTPTQAATRVCHAHRDLPPLDAGYHG